MLKNFSFSDVIVGIPAGFVIFMSLVLLSYFTRDILIDLPLAVRLWTALISLGIAASAVGLLAGWIRKDHGPTTAIVAGIVASGILLYLRFNFHSGEEYNPLVYGIPGMIVSVVFSLLSGWLSTRKAGNA